MVHSRSFTSGIEKFSAKKNIRKFLKVSHFCLGFSPNKNINEIKHSQRFLLAFLDPDLGNSDEILYEPENSDETLWECLILLWFSFHENHKEKWLTFKIFLKFSLTENSSMSPVIAQPGPVSFALELPPGLHRIHPVFHTSMLEPITPNSIPNHTQDPLPLIEIDSEVKYIVEAILDSKIDCCWTCPLQYFVKWEGYNGTPEEMS